MPDPNPRHLLIISGGRDLPERARAVEPGLRTSVICRQDVVPRLVHPEKIQRLIVLRADAPVAEWVAAAEFVHRTDPVDLITNYTEKDTEKTAAIGQALGLPTPAADTYELVADKLRMRQRLAERGVDGTPARVVRDAEEIRAFAEEAGYPLICKPLRGVGSEGVARIDAPSDIDRALAWAAEGAAEMDSPEILVEQFLTGAEFSVESISEGGRHVVACITQKISEREHFVEVGHVLPAPVGAEVAKRIEATVTAALDALEITSGVTHTEVIVTAGSVHIIETHLRPAGDEIPYMLARVSGIDLIDAVARQSLGLPALAEIEKKVDARTDTAQYAAIWYACPDAVGDVLAVDGVDEARSMPGVCEVGVLRGVGKKLRGVTGSFARAGHAWAVGATPQEALDRARDAAKCLTFTVAATGMSGAFEDLSAELGDLLE
ncbi:ATP-grasp domain-containing protein [Streptomyces sp. NPDC059629]|uniref:ATP-grasp domain-containing protein n=1 Tax=Streptomyces sp. NPDC059629 TaxID=3346889 RepID=UPI0036AE4E98